MRWIVLMSAALFVVGCSEATASDEQADILIDEGEAYAPPGLTFAGDPCTVDCSGHEAGYEWAEEQGIRDPDDCGGTSDSFIEGCQAYAGEREPVIEGEKL